jgi:hypothetical protein
MVDSDGNRYDGWAIAWDIAGKQYIAAHTVTWTRTACIHAFMKHFLNKTWRQLRRERPGLCCLKIRITPNA